MTTEEQDTRESEALNAAGISFDRTDAEPASEPSAFGGESPADADRRGAEQAPDPPIGPVVGAFVGAFVAAKVLGRLGGGDD